MRGQCISVILVNKIDFVSKKEIDISIQMPSCSYTNYAIISSFVSSLVQIRAANRVLLFCQMTQCMTIIEDYLGWRQFS